MKSKTSNGNGRRPQWRDILLIFTVSGFVVIMLVTSIVRDLTTFEMLLIQILMLGAGVASSALMGRAQAARDVIRPHARSALRQLLVLGDSLHRLSGRIEGFRASGDDPRLDYIQTVIDEQMLMGRRAVENWRDIVQDEVDEVYKEWTENPMWRDDDGSSD